MASKYRNQKTAVGNLTFASKREAAAYIKLLAAQKCGQIRDLKIQERFNIKINGQHVCAYVADFVFFDVDSGKTVVMDVKGFRTDVYKLKRKLMKAVLDIEIQEVS